MFLPLPLHRPSYVVALIGFVSLLGGCKKTPDPDPTPAPQPTITLKSDATLGNFLIDKQGRTLYYYGLDVAGSSKCLGGCLNVWPIYYEESLQVGPGLKAADFTSGQTASGQKQTFYKGWPLYYFATSTNGQWAAEPAGTTGGEGVGKDWFVMRPDYTLLVAKNAIINQASNQANTKIYLIDTKGHALYTYSKDGSQPASQPTNCQDGCITSYPVFYQAKVVVPSTMKASDFGTLTRTDGPNGGTRLQTTYKGQPLYYCAADNSVPGNAVGDGVSSNGDTWSVALP